MSARRPADPPRSDGIAAGWRLVRAWAEQNLPRAARRRIALLASGTGALVSIAGFVLLGLLPDTPTVDRLVLSVAIGVAAASLVAMILLMRATRPSRLRAVERRFTGRAALRAGTSRSIRQAWLRGDEPEVEATERWAAAVAAERLRATAPRAAVTTGAILPLWLAACVAAATLEIGDLFQTVSLLIMPVYGCFAVGSFLSTLHALGRTEAPLATAPARPEGLTDGGRKITKPYRVLGTDHPDDYA